MEAVNISVSVVMLVVLVPITLFIVYVIVMSVWDAWAPYVRGFELGEKLAARRARKPKVVGASEPEIAERKVDFSDKRARREAERYAWARDFLEALGEDREAFVEQWAPESGRALLAKQLRADEAEMRRVGNRMTAEVLNDMRHELTRDPEVPWSAKDLSVMEQSRMLVMRGEEGPTRRSLVSYHADRWRY